MFRRMKRQTQGRHPWGITTPLGDNFTPGDQLMLIKTSCEVASCEVEIKLRKGAICISMKP
jgi:hypothetical protein